MLRIHRSLSTNRVSKLLQDLHQISFLKKLDQSKKKNFILTIVSNPEHSDEIRSFPALEVTIVLCAPETAKIWRLHSKQVKKLFQFDLMEKDNYLMEIVMFKYYPMMENKL